MNSSSLYKMGFIAAGVLVGGVSGYLYYRLIGCSSGQCAITSNPVISTLYGALMGAFVAHSIHK